MRYRRLTAPITDDRRDARRGRGPTPIRRHPPAAPEAMALAGAKGYHDPAGGRPPADGSGAGTGGAPALTFPAPAYAPTKNSLLLALSGHTARYLAGAGDGQGGREGEPPNLSVDLDGCVAGVAQTIPNPLPGPPPCKGEGASQLEGERPAGRSYVSHARVHGVRPYGW